MFRSKIFKNYNTVNNEIEKKEEIIDNTKETIDYKINEFYDWYKNSKKENGHNYSKDEEKKIKNLIEKIAIWYELIYPNTKIRDIISESKENQINKIIINNNQLNNIENKNQLNWNDFYNINTFVKTMPESEKALLKKPKYTGRINITESGHWEICLEVKNNRIIYAPYINRFTNDQILEEDLIGLNLIEAKKLFENNNINVPKELEEKINWLNNQVILKEKLLNCVIYEIINRGGELYGPARAYLFAKEFYLNLDIPIKYVLTNDANIRYLINDYLKSGGTKDLECFIYYHMDINNNQKLRTIKLSDFLKKSNSYSLFKHTNEEKEKYQQIVTLLSNNIDFEKLEKKKIQDERIKRRIRQKELTSPKEN